MITLDFNNLYKIGEHGLSRSEMDDFAKQLEFFLEKIKSRGQGWYDLNASDEWVGQIEKYADLVRGKFEKVVVLGIGGSALGTTFLRDSLGHFYGMGERVKMHVVDNVDPEWLSELLQVLDLGKTLFVVVTKSGGTPETLAQFSLMRKLVEDEGLKWQEHFVFITDAKNGVLRKIANDHKDVSTFVVPENIGGRFSVLTAVGLLPAALYGIKIRELLRGAAAMAENFLLNDTKENMAYGLALAQYLLYKKGKNINVIMPYRQKLSRLSDWYKQLLAESIGKKYNLAGDVVNVGITPVSAVGVTDQHSQAQLFNEGPNDKLIMFVESAEEKVQLQIPWSSDLGSANEYLKGISFEKLLKTEMQASIDSLTENQRPNLKIILAKIDEENLGEVIMLLEGATAFLGEMLEVNTYDQPGVERGKVLTREYLSKK